jgi:hypothetical protein
MAHHDGRLKTALQLLALIAILALVYFMAVGRGVPS